MAPSPASFPGQGVPLAAPHAPEYSKVRAVFCRSVDRMGLSGLRCRSKAWGIVFFAGALALGGSGAFARVPEGLLAAEARTYQRILEELNNRAAHPASEGGVRYGSGYDEGTLRSLAESENPEIRETLARFLVGNDVESTRRSLDFVFETHFYSHNAKASRFLNEAASHHPEIRQSMEAILFSEHPRSRIAYERIISSLRHTIYDAVLEELSAQPPRIQERLIQLTDEFSTHDSYFTALEGLPDGLQRLVALSGNEPRTRMNNEARHRLIHHLPELPSELRQSLMDMIRDAVSRAQRSSTGWGGYSSWQGVDPDLEKAVSHLIGRNDLPPSLAVQLLGARYSPFAERAASYLQRHPSPESRDLLLRSGTELRLSPISLVRALRTALQPYAGQPGVDALTVESLRIDFDKGAFFALAERRGDPAVREGLISLIEADHSPQLSDRYLPLLRDLVSDPRVRRQLVTWLKLHVSQRTGGDRYAYILTSYVDEPDVRGLFATLLQRDQADAAVQEALVGAAERYPEIRALTVDSPHLSGDALQVFLTNLAQRSVSNPAAREEFRQTFRVYEKSLRHVEGQGPLFAALGRHMASWTFADVRPFLDEFAVRVGTQSALDLRNAPLGRLVAHLSSSRTDVFDRILGMARGRTAALTATPSHNARMREAAAVVTADAVRLRSEYRPANDDAAPLQPNERAGYREAALARSAHGADPLSPFLSEAQRVHDLRDLVARPDLRHVAPELQQALSALLEGSAAAVQCVPESNATRVRRVALRLLGR